MVEPLKPVSVQYLNWVLIMAKFRSFQKLIRRSDTYKYVTLITSTDFNNVDEVWVADLRHASGGKKNTLFYKTEKEAAIAVDLELIKRGKEPINVLTRKKP